MAKRRITKPVYVGDVKVGGDAPITVQSMTKSDTRDVGATVAEIRGLEEAGCEIIRSAVPDMEAAQALGEIKRQIHIPLIADIHFHYQLALESLRQGVDCLRLNPGNIRDSERVKEVVQEAKDRQVPIRIGVNFGSLPPVGQIGVTRGQRRSVDGVNLLTKGSGAVGETVSVVDHMVATALWEIGILEEMDFDLIKISLKAYDVDTTVEAYHRLATMVPYPFHLGITEAGTAKSGTVRSAVGLGILLYDGIGGHDSRLAQRRVAGGGGGGLRDFEVPGPAQEGGPDGGLPLLRPSRRGHPQAGQHGGGAAEAVRQAGEGGGDGMRGERPRRGQGRRGGHRRGQRPGRYLPQGAEGPRGGGSRHAHRSHGGGQRALASQGATLHPPGHSPGPMCGVPIAAGEVAHSSPRRSAFRLRARQFSSS